MPSQSVTFVVNSVPPSRNRTRYQHVSEMSEQFDLTIVTNAGVPEEIHQQANKVHKYSDGILSRFQLLYPLWLIYAVISVDSDIVISEHRGYSLFACWLAQLNSNRSFIADIWDDPRLPLESYLNPISFRNLHKTIYYGFAYFLAQLFLPRADLVITSIHPGILSSYDIPKENHVSLTNGVIKSLNESVDPEVNQEKISIIYVGKVNEKRDSSGFIEQILRIETDKDIIIHLVGQISSVARRKIAGLESDCEVLIHGRLPHEETLNFIAGADIALCLLPSNIKNYKYSYPVKLFEYGLFGKATIASNFVGISQIIENRESGILVDPTDEKAIRKCLVQLVSDDDLRDRLGRNFANKIEDYYWDDIRSEYTHAIRNQYFERSDRDR